jgi:hypothetical protein
MVNFSFYNILLNRQKEQQVKDQEMTKHTQHAEDVTERHFTDSIRNAVHVDIPEAQ